MMDVWCFEEVLRVMCLKPTTHHIYCLCDTDQIDTTYQYQ